MFCPQVSHFSTNRYQQGPYGTWGTLNMVLYPVARLWGIRDQAGVIRRKTRGSRVEYAVAVQPLMQSVVEAGVVVAELRVRTRCVAVERSKIRQRVERGCGVSATRLNDHLHSRPLIEPQPQRIPAHKRHTILSPYSFQIHTLLLDGTVSCSETESSCLGLNLYSVTFPWLAVRSVLSCDVGYHARRDGSEPLLLRFHVFFAGSDATASLARDINATR